MKKLFILFSFFLLFFFLFPVKSFAFFNLHNGNGTFTISNRTATSMTLTNFDPALTFDDYLPACNYNNKYIQLAFDSDGTNPNGTGRSISNITCSTNITTNTVALSFPLDNIFPDATTWQYGYLDVHSELNYDTCDDVTIECHSWAYDTDNNWVAFPDISSTTPTPTPTYSITGTVYNDDNKNGSQDTGEIGYNGATVTLNSGQTTIATATTDANGNYTIPNLPAGSYTETLTVPTGYSATTTNPAPVTVSGNTTENFGIYSLPVVSVITAPTSPVQVNTAVSVNATFTEPDTTDTQHIATWHWGDNSSSAGTVTEPNGSTPGTVTGSHTYAAAGSYIVYLTVTDDDGTPATGTSPQTVVAISPSGGLTGSNLTGDNYSGADLSNQNLSNSNLKNTTFTDVNLQGANLTGVNVKSADLQGANLTGADLTNTNLKGANLSNANLTGANLTGAILTGATITGITWSNTTCPDGTNSNNHNNTCIGHGGGL